MQQQFPAGDFTHRMMINSDDVWSLFSLVTIQAFCPHTLMVNAAGGQFLQTYGLDAENCPATRPLRTANWWKFASNQFRGDWNRSDAQKAVRRHDDRCGCGRCSVYHCNTAPPSLAASSTHDSRRRNTKRRRYPQGVAGWRCANYRLRRGDQFHNP